MIQFITRKFLLSYQNLSKATLFAKSFWKIGQLDQFNLHLPEEIANIWNVNLMRKAFKL